MRLGRAVAARNAPAAFFLPVEVRRFMTLSRDGDCGRHAYDLNPEGSTS
jgi:hypothetical protein